MKNELLIISNDGHEVVSEKISDWIDHDNKEHYQRSLANKYYWYVTTREYPIPVTGELFKMNGSFISQPLEFNT